jgi:hypothetical protein
MPVIPATKEAEVRRTKVPSQPEQKVIKTLSQTSQACLYMLIIPFQKMEVGGSWLETVLGKNMRPYLKNKLNQKGLWV